MKSQESGAWKASCAGSYTFLNYGIIQAKVWGVQLVKRVLAVLLSLLFLTACAVAPDRQKPEKTCVAGEPTFVQTAVAIHSIPPAPTLTPVPTCTPQPVVRQDWYVQRNRDLRILLKRNGSFQSEMEITAAIDKMAIDPDKPMVALTFDDGPMPGVTDEILDILAQYNVRATFFVLGWRLEKPASIDMIRRAVAQGCEIGNHTYLHENLSQKDANDTKWTLSATNRAVYDATGYVMHDMRPSGGRLGFMLSSVCRRMDMAVVLWAQSGNVMETDPAKIAQNVQKQIVNGKELHDGDIILLHDTKKHMVEAVKIIVPQLLDEGYQLVTVWELLNLSEGGFVPGQVYRHQ